jgi:hypothetical protein
MCASQKTHTYLLSAFVFVLSLLTPCLSAQVLIPMDETHQRDHLKAYGLLYNAIEEGYDCHWLLNFRGGSFAILDADSKLIQQALLRGVSYESRTTVQLVQLMADLASPRTKHKHCCASTHSKDCCLFTRRCTTLGRCRYYGLGICGHPVYHNL